MGIALWEQRPYSQCFLRPAKQQSTQGKKCKSQHMLASIFSRHFEVSTAEIMEADPSRSPSAAAKEPF